jgi:hypothetical protein
MTRNREKGKESCRSVEAIQKQQLSDKKTARSEIYRASYALHPFQNVQQSLYTPLHTPFIVYPPCIYENLILNLCSQPLPKNAEEYQHFCKPLEAENFQENYPGIELVAKRGYSALPHIRKYLLNIQLKGLSFYTGPHHDGESR